MQRCCTDLVRILCSLAALPALLFASPTQAAEPLDLDQALRISQAAVGKPIGDYTLTAGDGRRVRLSDYRGKPLLVGFVYTGCSQICPTTARFLARAVREAQAALGPDAFATLTIGFNLPFDSPQAMRAFAAQNDLDLPRWEFLSPDAADVAPLTRDFGFVYAPTAAGFDHLTQVTIVDANGRVFRQVYGETFELPMLVGPLRALVTGAPAPLQNLSTFLERVRILCTVYDPLSGRYRLDYGLFVEIFAGVSILAGVLYYLLAEWRRQRQVT